MRDLVIEADLDLHIDGDPVRVATEGGRVYVDAESLDVASRMLRSGPFRGRAGVRLEQVHEWLMQTGQTVELRVDGKPIGRLGPEARPGALSRLIRLRQAEIDTSAALRQTVHERPGLVAGFLGGIGLAGALVAFWLRRE